MWRGGKEERNAAESGSGGEVKLWGRRAEQIQFFVFQLSLTSSPLFANEISLSPSEKTRLGFLHRRSGWSFLERWGRGVWSQHGQVWHNSNVILIKTAFPRAMCSTHSQLWISGTNQTARCIFGPTVTRLLLGAHDEGHRYPKCVQTSAFGWI